MWCRAYSTWSRWDSTTLGRLKYIELGHWSNTNVCHRHQFWDSPPCKIHTKADGVSWTNNDIRDGCSTVDIMDCLLVDRMGLDLWTHLCYEHPICKWQISGIEDYLKAFRAFWHRPSFQIILKCFLQVLRRFIWTSTLGGLQLMSGWWCGWLRGMIDWLVGQLWTRIRLRIRKRRRGKIAPRWKDNFRSVLGSAAGPMTLMWAWHHNEENYYQIFWELWWYEYDTGNNHLSGRGKQGTRRLLRYLAKASLTSLEKSLEN